MVPLLQLVTHLVVLDAGSAVQVMFLNAYDLELFLSHEPVVLFPISKMFIKGCDINLQDMDTPFGGLLSPWGLSLGWGRLPPCSPYGACAPWVPFGGLVSPWGAAGLGWGIIPPCIPLRWALRGWYPLGMGWPTR